MIIILANWMIFNHPDPKEKRVSYSLVKCATFLPVVGSNTV
jgi:hypothetical protein